MFLQQLLVVVTRGLSKHLIPLEIPSQKEVFNGISLFSFPFPSSFDSMSRLTRRISSAPCLGEVATLMDLSQIMLEKSLCHLKAAVPADKSGANGAIPR